MSENHTFTGNKRYRKQRKILLEENPICQMCDDAPAEELDHIIPLHLWDEELNGSDPNDTTNLQGLCKDCHEMKTAREQGKRIVRVDIRGRPIGPSNLDI